MTELKQNVLNALDELLDSDELGDEWLKVNMLYHQLESVFEDEEDDEDE